MNDNTRTCPNCHTELTPRTDEPTWLYQRRKFCTNDCAMAHKGALTYPRPCAGNCGRTVRNKHTTARKHPGTVPASAGGMCALCRESNETATPAAIITDPLPTIASRDASWMDDATCTQVDPEIFHPGKGQSPDPAKNVCNGVWSGTPCPVRDACLKDALDTNDNWGIRGGLTAQERRALKKARKDNAA